MHLTSFKKLIFFGTFLLTSIVFLSCGSGGSTSGSSTLVSGLGPNPEDIHDIPNALPNDFTASACPITGGYTQVYDLRVTAKSSLAQTYDYNGDGVIDSTLLHYGDLNPQTVIFHVDSITSSAIPPSNVNTSLQNIFLGGYMKDTNNQTPPFATTLESFQNDILHPGAWKPNYITPIVTERFVPNTPPPGGPDQPAFFPWGFEGHDPGGPNAMCSSFDSDLCPGVHIIVAYIHDNNGITHCTQFPWLLIVCPVAGICP